MPVYYLLSQIQEVNIDGIHDVVNNFVGKY